MIIYNYWFSKSTKEWFMSGSSLDKEIKDNYEKYFFLYKENKLKNWEKSKIGILSLIILLDQFPRHIYRNTTQAYSYDNDVYKLVINNLDILNELNGWEKVFFLLPLQHQEDIEIQEYNKTLWDKILSEEKNAEYLKIYKRVYNHVIGHLQTIKEFGRFPKRNKFLGRTNTEQEHMYFKIHPTGHY